MTGAHSRNKGARFETAVTNWLRSVGVVHAAQDRIRTLDAAIARRRALGGDMTEPTPLFVESYYAGPGGRCGHQSPADVGDHRCEREPGHPGHLHWARGPRSQVDPMWRTWTVDWRSE